MAVTQRALAFASRWFDPDTVHRVFEPLIADWQREWHNAPASHRWSASLSGLWAFIVATIASFPRIVLRPAPPAVMHRVVTRVALLTLLLSVFLIVPFFLEVQLTWWLQVPMIPLLVPQAVTATFPFAMVPAVDAIRRHEALPPHIARAAVTKVGLTAVLLMVVFHGWVTPAANQAWRRASARQVMAGQGIPPARFREPARGIRELSTFELIVAPSRGSYPLITARQELNNRASFAVLPVFCLWLRWRSLDLPRRRWWPLPPSLATLAIMLAWVLLRELFEDRLSMPRGMGAWMAPAALLAFSLAEQWLSQRRLVRQ